MKSTLLFKNGVILILISSLLASCASVQHEKTKYRRAPGGDGYFSQDHYSQDEKRIVIFNAALDITVKNADTLNHQLVELSKKYNGYAVTLGNRSSTIRVMAKNLNAALQELSTIGKVKGKTLSGTDVTDEYHDFEIRLENFTKARQRYLELLEKAENVEATLKVEKELERLNGEIDSLKGKMERLSHLSDYSTIEINIQEKQKLGILGHVVVSAYKVVKWLFVRG